MTPKKWWDNLDITDRDRLLRECPDAAGYGPRQWSELPEFIKRHLATYHTNHLGTIKVEVTTWSTNSDRRPKKHYCSDCGALMHANYCWRCGK